MPEVIFLSDITEKRPNPRYIGPYTIASYLEEHSIKTVVIDYFTKMPNFFDFIESFISEETKIIGISSTFLMSDPVNHKDPLSVEFNYWSSPLWFESKKKLFDWTLKLKNLIKDKGSNAKIIVGGGKAIINDSYFADFEDNAYRNIDYFVLGSAEIALLDTFFKLKENKEPDYESKNGIKIIKNSNDLKTRWCPQTKYSKNWSIQKNEALPLEVSRGCLYSCKFCRYDKKQSTRKPLSELKDELVRNYEHYGVTFYYLTDDCFNDRRSKIEEVCNLFLSLPFKIEYVSYARVDVAITFPETLDLMIQSGGSGFLWGVETLNKKAGMRAGKGMDPEKVKGLFQRLYENYRNDCINELSFIVGLPEETEETQLNTFEWIKSNLYVDFLAINPLGLFPFIPELDRVVIDFADYSKNPEKYGFSEVHFNPPYWKHSTMDLTKAKQLASNFQMWWNSSGRKGQITTIWQYPLYRSLGLTKQEIFDICRNVSMNSDELVRLGHEKMNQFRNKYWTDLIENIHS